MIIYIKNIDTLSEKQFEFVYKLISKSGEIKIDTLKQHLKDTALIAYAKFNSKIVGTAAIKKPTDEYFDSVFIKSNSPFDYNFFKYELGYVFVQPQFRGQRIALKLCKRLCDYYICQNLYSTVRSNNFPMHSILKKNGFSESGKEFYNRERTEKIKLFIKEKIRDG